MDYKPRSSQFYLNRYVDHQAGRKVFLVSVVLACVLGVGLRLFFNPQRLKSLAEEALANQGSAVAIGFRSAKLRFSNGAVPIIAIEMKGVTIAASKNCPLAPGIVIDELRLPLRISKLLQGEIAIGVFQAEKVMVDVEALKAECPNRPERASVSREANRSSQADTRGSLASEAENLAWWKTEDVDRIAGALQGVEFGHVEIFFENKSKKVILESFEMERGREPGAMRLGTRLLIPPEIVYGERVPPLEIEAVVKPDRAQVSLDSAFSEGRLRAQLELSPRRDGYLDADLQVAVKEVPLSTLVPLATKSGVVQGEFRPRFMWVNCEARVRGRFQGLVTDHPLILRECEVLGGGDSRVRLANATRKPDGRWEPMRIELQNVAIEQLLETFAWRGPDGVFGTYGWVSGEALINGEGASEFSGQIERSKLRFANRSLETFQDVERFRMQLFVDEQKIRGQFADFRFADRGQLDGEIDYVIERHSLNGRAGIVIRSLVFSEAVDQLLFRGRLAKIEGAAKASISAGKLSGLEGELKLMKLDGDSFSFGRSRVEIGFDRVNEEIAVDLHSPDIKMSMASEVMKAAQPIFLEHQFTGDWTEFRNVKVRGRFKKEGGFMWETASMSLEKERIQLLSSGGFDQDRQLKGWVKVDSPNFKNLRWSLSGRFDQPVFTADAITADVLAGSSKDLER